MKIRTLIQTLFLLCSLYIGVSFAHYLHSIMTGDMNVVKPGGVEAFLPISAFMSFKYFLMTGVFDRVHPAGLSLFIIFLIISAVFKRSFCGYVCPVGFVSELISKTGAKVRLNRYAGYILSLPKYLLFIFFFAMITMMSAGAIAAFQRSQYNMVADAKMLYFFTRPTMTTAVVIGAIVLLTLVIKGFWCRFLCPYGVLQSIAGYLSPFYIKRHKEHCTNCGKCAKACPMGIEVNKKGMVLSPDCIGCHDCVRVRDNDRCLTVGRGYRPDRLAVWIVCVLSVLVIFAMVAGFWDSSIKSADYLRLLNGIDGIGH